MDEAATQAIAPTMPRRVEFVIANARLKLSSRGRLS